MLIRNSPTISPPVNRKVCLNRFTHSGLGERMLRRDPAVKRAVLLAESEDRLRVGDRRLDLEPVADDAGIAQQSLHIPFAESSDDLGIEVRGTPRERPPAS